MATGTNVIGTQNFGLPEPVGAAFGAYRDVIDHIYKGLPSSLAKKALQNLNFVEKIAVSSIDVVDAAKNGTPRIRGRFPLFF